MNGSLREFKVRADGFLFRCAGVVLEPSLRRVIVVCPRVDHGVWDKFMREIRVLRRIAGKSELQNAHAGKAELLAKRGNFRNHQAEVLRDKRGLGYLFEDLFKEVCARTGNVTAFHRG